MFMMYGFRLSLLANTIAPFRFKPGTCGPIGDGTELCVMVGVARFKRDVLEVSAIPSSADATELPAVLEAVSAFGPWVNVREKAKLRSPGVLVKRLAKSRRICVPNLIS